MAQDKTRATNGFTFRDVLRDELSVLKELREEGHEGAAAPPNSLGAAQGLSTDAAAPTDPFDDAHELDLVGLALSGGGIRSATFNLGVIQALAKQREREEGDEVGMLPWFDYLSTVSGGGYIGSWLTAFLHRDTLRKRNLEGGPVRVDRGTVARAQAKLSTHPCEVSAPVDKVSAPPHASDEESDCREASGFEEPRSAAFPPLEHAAVRHLRRYSNYLSPRLGVSGDILAVASLFLRNLVLLQVVLVGLLACTLLVPYCVGSVSQRIVRPGLVTTVGSLVAIVGLLGTALAIWRHQIWRRLKKGELATTGAAKEMTQGPKEGKSANTQAATRMTTGRWMALATVLVTISSWLIVITACRYLAAEGATLARLFIFSAAGYAVGWSVGPSYKQDPLADASKSQSDNRIGHVACCVVSALVFGGLIALAAKLVDSGTLIAAGHLLEVVTFGPALVLLLLSFTIAVHLGVARDLFMEQHREWWARVGGEILLAAGAWVLVFSVAFFTPPFVAWLEYGGLAAIVAWVGASGVGASMATSATTSGSGRDAYWKGLAVRIAPWVFVGGLAMIVSLYLYKVMCVWMHTSADAPLVSIAVALSPDQAAIALATMLAAVLLASWRLDLNIFSAHGLYKNRLVRAYLGASQGAERNPIAYIGFDPSDDLALADLSAQRPLAILNATVNATGGDDLAWQTRRAAAFAFTPQYVGFEAKNSLGRDLGGYRRTERFAVGSSSRGVRRRECHGMTLGTALAISGAAASPNMGYHTSPAVSALLTVLNLRLGYWAGNPKLTEQERNGGGAAEVHAAWRKERPLFCVRPILQELSGSANASAPWINLTDGGHFDNLGIYELVRRRCRFIVASDAGRDPKHSFEDLANTIRKCWTDFGVHIVFPFLDDVRLRADHNRWSREHGCFGLIEYPDREKTCRGRFGLILYLKCSLTEHSMKTFADIRQYADTHETFPHESTGDQFFDENQFEAYRHLGYCVASQFKPKIESLFDRSSGHINEKKVEHKVTEVDSAQQRRKAGPVK